MRIVDAHEQHARRRFLETQRVETFSTRLRAAIMLERTCSHCGQHKTIRQLSLLIGIDPVVLVAFLDGGDVDSRSIDAMFHHLETIGHSPELRTMATSGVPT